MLDYGYSREIGANTVYEGDIANTFPCRKLGGTLISGNDYPFGSAIAWDGYNKRIKVVNSATDKIIGVLPRSEYSEDYKDSNDLYGYDATTLSQVWFLDQGGIAVLVEQDINHGDPVYARHTVNGTFLRTGIFRKDDDTGNATLIPNGVWYPAYETVEDGIIAKANTLAVLLLK